MCVPIDEGIEPGQQLELIELAAGAAASVVHRGGYEFVRWVVKVLLQGQGPPLPRSERTLASRGP